MKKNILILVLVTLVMQGVAKDTSREALLDSAKLQYDKGDYVKAISLYNGLLDHEQEAAGLHYNLGNAYFKKGNKGMAVLHYEKALRIDQGHEDALFNLSLVNQQLIDQFEKIPSFSFRPLFVSVDQVISHGLLAVLSLLSLTLSAVLILWAKLNRKRVSFNQSWGLMLLALVLYSWGAIQKSQLNSGQAAVVASNDTPARSEPNSSSTLLFELNEGTKVIQLGESGNWYNVKTPDGNQGWIKQDLLLPI